MPTGDETPRQRASSPSEQSSRICSWIRSTAKSGPQSPGRVSAAAASTPTTSISHVIALGVIRVGTTARVRYGETRRTYRRPAQCSPLLRSKIEAGCVAARSSAIVGIEELPDGPLHVGLAEREVLEDGEAIRARARGGDDGLHELLLGEPQITRRAGEAV